MSVSTIWAPREARAQAVARPSPEALPVTKAMRDVRNGASEAISSADLSLFYQSIHRKVESPEACLSPRPSEPAPRAATVGDTRYYISQQQ